MPPRRPAAARPFIKQRHGRRPSAFLALVVALAGTWTLFFCHFSRQQQRQLEQLAEATALVDLAAASSGPAPIGPRVLQPPVAAAAAGNRPGDEGPVVYKDFEHDTDCLRRGQGQVFFLHMRKAGGSSVRTVLTRVHDALKPATSLLAKVSGAFKPKSPFRLALVEGPTMNVSCFDERSRVFVTTVRDPIDRIISSYYYEGRFGRFDAHMFHDQAEADAAAAMLARVKNRRTLLDEPLGFREWVDQTRRSYYERETPSYRHENVWLSVENYYIKTLVNRHRADTTQPVTRADLELAKRILANIDAVLITEWLGDPDQTAYFTRRLGLDERQLGFNVSFGHAQRTRQPRARAARKATGGEVRAEDDAETLELLRALNALDIELYEFAKELVQERIQRTLSAPALPPLHTTRDDGRTCKQPPPRDEATRRRRAPLCLLPASVEEDRFFGGSTKFHQLG